jgi:hypothetical protein
MGDGNLRKAPLPIAGLRERLSSFVASLLRMTKQALIDRLEV